MKKKELRKLYKERRSTLQEEEIQNLSIAIANKILELPIWDYSFYHLFLPIEKQHEVNTEFILHILQGKDKNVVLPKSNFENHSLKHFLLTDTTRFTVNQWGIPEPVEGIVITEDQIEVVFIPLLAYDTLGNRVGYGKGFYDRFLAKCRPETIKIGLSFFEPERQIEGVLLEDVKLNYCVSPIQIYKF